MMMTDPSIIISTSRHVASTYGTKERSTSSIAVLAAQGRSIIVVSSEMQELIAFRRSWACAWRIVGR